MTTTSHQRVDLDERGDVDQPQPAAVNHRTATRWMHWINFPILAIMIWTGMRIYWSDLRDPYVLGIGGRDLVVLFPDWFNETFKLEAKLARGLSHHLVFGWVFVINGLIYVIHTFFSGHWRELDPRTHGIRGALQTVRSTFRRSKKKHDHVGYNPAQRIAYSTITLLGAGSAISGFAIYRPNTLSPLPWLLGGYQTARTIHFTITMVFILFFFVHIVQVIRAGSTNLTGMITAPPTASVAPSPDETGDGDRPEKADSKPIRPSTQTRRALLRSAGAVGLTLFGWRWLQNQPRADAAPRPLRKGLEVNERVWRPLDQAKSSARTFDPSKASPIRVNGLIGLSEPAMPTWNLRVTGKDGELLDELSLDDITDLPFYEMTVEHICVEGWSEIVTWGGARFSDFADRYQDVFGADYDYVNLSTPDKEYYVSLDSETMKHPQTLLAYRLNGEPLTEDHGAPLRLATPFKYGIKQLKRIGSIEFSDSKGPDYWTERGYDWYSHL